MPCLVPDTYRRLAREPGGCSYWDASVAAAVNAVLNGVLAIYAIVREPALLNSSDLFLKTPETCRMITVFFAWLVFETAMQFFNWGRWPSGRAMLVHHFAGGTAWFL